jgi:hypothetical protein
MRMMLYLKEKLSQYEANAVFKRHIALRGNVGLFSASLVHPIVSIVLSLLQHRHIIIHFHHLKCFGLINPC